MVFSARPAPSRPCALVTLKIARLEHPEHKQSNKHEHPDQDESHSLAQLGHREPAW
jgi:hypothetical protein